MGISDISGRLIPLPNAGGGTATAATATPSSFASPTRLVAVPSIRERPNESSQELLVQAYGNLAAGGAAFVALTNAVVASPASFTVPPDSRARIDSMLVFCPDMVSALAPYLFARLVIGGDPAPAWGNVAVFPRSGVAAVEFDLSLFLSPGQKLELFAMNTDLVNTHFVGLYLRGWQWPKDYVDG